MGFKLGRRPALDGVRAVAILTVLAFHFRENDTAFGTRGGFFGVDVFFVLSGFLITMLLYEELRDCGTLRFGSFYARRALRLLPALGLMLACFLVWSLLFGPQSEVHSAKVQTLATVLYAQNWVQAFTSQPSRGIDHTWSLAIEEQFYIVWPLLLFLLIRLGRLRLAIGFCIVGLLTVPLLRIVEWQGDASVKRFYFSTDTRADSLLAGCLLALLMAAGIGRGADKLLRRSGYVATAFLAACFVAAEQRSPFLYSVGFSLFALATSILLYNIVSNRWFAVVLEHRTMLWIGRRSYGIYLWHWPLLVVATKYVGRASYAVAIALPLTFIVAALSYRYLEQPVLRLKQRYVARPIASTAVASTS